MSKDIIWKIWNDVMSSFDDAKKTFFYQKAPKILTLPASNGSISLAVSVPSGHETSFGCSMDVQKTSMATGLSGHQICY